MAQKDSPKPSQPNPEAEDSPEEPAGTPEGDKPTPARTSLSHNASAADLTIGELSRLVASQVRLVLQASRPPSGVHVNSGPPGFVNGGGHANFDPGGTITGAHVNSGPPGFVNGGGHANFDPRSGVRPRARQRLTLPDGGIVDLPLRGRFDFFARGFRIKR